MNRFIVLWILEIVEFPSALATNDIFMRFGHWEENSQAHWPVNAGNSIEILGKQRGGLPKRDSQHALTYGGRAGNSELIPFFVGWSQAHSFDTTALAKMTVPITLTFLSYFQSRKFYSVQCAASNTASL